MFKFLQMPTLFLTTLALLLLSGCGLPMVYTSATVLEKRFEGLCTRMCTWSRISEIELATCVGGCTQLLLFDVIVYQQEKGIMKKTGKKSPLKRPRPRVHYTRIGRRGVHKWHTAMKLSDRFP